MKFKKPLLFNVAIAVCISAAIIALSKQPFLKRLELSALDYYFNLRQKVSYNPNIVIIEITDKDIEQIGRWPWDRSWHAAITKALDALGAKFIYFDIIFSEPSDEKNDGLFEEAIKEANKVYLPFVFQSNSTDIKKAFLPIPRFGSYIKGTGSINIYPDLDGTLRRIPLVFQAGKEGYPHVALQMAMDYLNLNLVDVQDNYLLLSSGQEKIKIPLTSENTMLVNWVGKWQNTFKHYSFLDILAAYQDTLDGKKPRINVSDIKNSISLVALTAIGLYDIKPIPLQPEYPGIGVIANTISNITSKNFLHYPAGWLNIFLILLFSFIPAFLIFGEKPLGETLVIFLIGSVFAIITFLLFKERLIIEPTRPLLGLSLSYLIVETYNFIRISIERQRFFKMAVTDGLTSLFNIRYFKMLLETEIMLAKHDPLKKFSIVMSDVDHFKHFNDTYGHQVGDLVLKEVAAALKSSVRSSDLVARYGGEEMIVLLRGSSLSDGINIAEKIRKNIEERVVKDEKNSYKVTISLGVASFHPGDDVDNIIKRADNGLYKAKEGGRNRVETEEGIDGSTGLYDNKCFDLILKDECVLAVKSEANKFCIMLIGIDQIKKIHDENGHQALEFVIKEAASALRTFVRSSDIVARCGTEEIIILLRGSSLFDGIHIAEKIRKRVEESPVKDGDNIYKVTLSIGVSAYKSNDTTESLLERAREMLKKSQSSGGNCVFNADIIIPK